MDRETWRAAVLGVARVRRDLVTKQQQQGPLLWFLLKVFSSSQAPLPKLNIPILIQRIHLPPSHLPSLVLPGAEGTVIPSGLLLRVLNKSLWVLCKVFKCCQE